MTLPPHRMAESTKRMGWDSNPGYPLGYSNFQDCRLRPLGHPSSDAPQDGSEADRGIEESTVESLMVSIWLTPFFGGFSNLFVCEPAEYTQRSDAAIHPKAAGHRRS